MTFELARTVNVDTVFLIGLGLEICGAVLLAQGAILNYREILSNASSGFGYSSKKAALHLKAKTNAIVGLLGIVLGYVLQSSGYLWDTWAAPTIKPSIESAAVGAIGALLGIILLLALKRWPGRYFRNAAAVKVVRKSYSKGSNKLQDKRNLLEGIGVEFGYPPRNKGLTGTDSQRAQQRFLRKYFGTDLSSDTSRASHREGADRGE